MATISSQPLKHKRDRMISHNHEILWCMQYKFYVDGKWGYDESEHHVTGDYGIVNTLCLQMTWMLMMMPFRHVAKHSL
ncbi:hypothetical protein ACB092_11G046500 [Castanea dentata]